MKFLYQNINLWPRRLDRDNGVKERYHWPVCLGIQISYLLMEDSGGTSVFTEL